MVLNTSTLSIKPSSRLKVAACKSGHLAKLAQKINKNCVSCQSCDFCCESVQICSFRVANSYYWRLSIPKFALNSLTKLITPNFSRLPSARLRTSKYTLRSRCYRNWQGSHHPRHLQQDEARAQGG